MRQGLIPGAAVCLAVMAAPVGAATIRKAMAETWLWPELVPVALDPIGRMVPRLIADGTCPDLQVAADGRVHVYQVDVRMKKAGRTSERWWVEDLRINNPSSCAALDQQVADRLKAEAPVFVEPRIDANGDGWTRLPGIDLRVTR
jgi:hypothetical protein